MRIQTLLQKLTELAKQDEKATVLEIDLMMDYTRVLYADLIEWRNRVLLTSSLDDTIQQPKPAPQPATPPVIPPSPYMAAPEEAAPVVMPLQTIENDAPQPVRADIRDIIGINDKYQFISELFGNNKDAYNEVLDEINTFDTYDEAISWLRNAVASQYSWEEEHETVQSFHRLLSQFFSSM